MVDTRLASGCFRTLLGGVLPTAALHQGRVDLGDLDVERGDPTTDGRFVVELLDRGELRLHLAEQLRAMCDRSDRKRP